MSYMSCVSGTFINQKKMQFTVHLREHVLDVECPSYAPVNDLLRAIEKQYWSVAKSRTWIRFIQNGKGSVVDNDFTVCKALNDGEIIVANTGRLDAHRVQRILAPSKPPRKTKSYKTRGARPLTAYERFRVFRYANQREGDPPITFVGLSKEWKQLTREEREAHAASDVNTHRWQLRYEAQDGVATVSRGVNVTPIVKRLVIEHDLMNLHDNDTLQLVLDKFNMITNRRQRMKWLTDLLVTKLGFPCHPSLPIPISHVS